MLAVSLIFESSFLNLEHSFNIPRQWGYVNHRIDTRGIVHTMSLLKVYLGYIAIGVLWWMGSQILEKWTSFFLHDVTLANNQGSRILIQRLEGENSVYVTYAVYGTSNYIHPWAESGVGWRKFINYASPILVWTSNVEESQCDFIKTFEKKMKPISLLTFYVGKLSLVFTFPKHFELRQTNSQDCLILSVQWIVDR